MGPEDVPYSRVTLEMIEEFGVDPAEFTTVFHPLDHVEVGTGITDVVFTYVGASPEKVEAQIREGARVFSFDDASLDGKGSRVDGLLLRHPRLRSFVIPRNTFDRYPEEPVLTVAVTITLVTRESMDEGVVFDLVSAVFDRSSYLFERHPLLGFLSVDMERMALNFPLHEGTLQYLNRDQPTFIERYAEVLALAFSVGVVLLGAASSVSRMLRRRKKDRIDVYYERVLEIAARRAERGDGDEDRGGDGTEGAVEAAARRREPEELRERAVRQLRDERLEASESFSIFLDLVHHEIDRCRRTEIR